MRSVWSDAVVCVTGGSGSFGHAWAKRILAEPIRALRILSRDELKQSQMARKFSDRRLRFMLGDVRSLERLERVFDGVDIVINAAAMKRIEACEYDPDEAVATNITGVQNVIAAARSAGVQRVLGLSSDKATDAQTTYGGTKFVGERLMVRANEDPKPTRFAVCRYGNITASRGSFVPLLMEQRASGTVTVTDARCTRFWMTLDQATLFVKQRIEQMQGGELFVPKLPSYAVVDLIQAVAPECLVKVIGMRGDEKVHEMMISLPESRRTQSMGSFFTVLADGGVGPEFTYTSDQNEKFLSVSELREALPSAIEQAA